MSEPIPDAAVGGIPDLAAAAALVDLITLLHTDPLARCLISGMVWDKPSYGVWNGTLSLRLDDPSTGAQQLAAAKALFGGEAKEVSSYRSDSVGYTLATTWNGVPFEVRVEIPREDEVAELKKQLAELRQRHQLLDPAVPPLPMSSAAVAE